MFFPIIISAHDENLVEAPRLKGSITASHSPPLSPVHSALAPPPGKVWNHPTDPPLVSLGLDVVSLRMAASSPKPHSLVFCLGILHLDSLPVPTSPSSLCMSGGQALPLLTPTFYPLGWFLAQG